MSIFIKKDKKRAALEKEYASVLKKETQLKQSAMKTTAPRWKTDLEKKVPEKFYRSLETAFSKAFPWYLLKASGSLKKPTTVRILKRPIPFRIMPSRSRVAERN